MREIKYRGQKIDTKEWVEGLPRYTEYSPKPKIGAIEDIDGIFHEIIPETVGEYTGLKDKAGKEIYEGDILEMKNVGWKYTIVKFHIGTLAFFVSETNYLIPMVPQYWEEGKVIGNIHDNPELI